MAEGFLRHLAGNRLEPCSAGTKPAAAVHPLAVKVMAEVGIDISSYKPKHAAAFSGLPVTYLITVCGNADQECPRSIVAAVDRMHWPFDDPAAIEGSEAEKLEGFRRVRDEIKEKVKSWVARFGVVA